MQRTAKEGRSDHLKRVHAAIEPLRTQIKSAFWRFIAGGLLAIAIATGIVWPLGMIPVPIRAAAWMILVAAGAAVAHRELGKVSGEAASRVQASVLESFGLVFRGDLRCREFNSPFDKLGLLPEGERVTYGRRYEGVSSAKILVQEIEVQEVQIQTVRPTVLRVYEHWRTKFLGQGIEAELPNYKGGPFVLAPRRNPLSSLQLDARNKFLGMPFARDMSVRPQLLEKFQVWQPEPAAGQGMFPDEIADAALDIASLFPGNRVWMSITATATNSRPVFRMTTDFGRLYRDESGPLSAIQDSVIEDFYCKLARLMWSLERIEQALLPSQTQPPNVPTTGT